MNQDGRRVVKVERQVQEIIAQFLIRGFRTPKGGLITVSRVIMPADLRSAKVFLSIFGENIDKDEVLELIQERSFEFQKYLASELKARYCPKLSFWLDESTEKVLKIEKTIEELSKKD